MEGQTLPQRLPLKQEATLADASITLNPAELASQIALNSVFESLERGESFILEAGAGAGKTYSLVEALRYLIKAHRVGLQRRHQRIACITFTNVAKDEIIARTDKSPLVVCDTIHAFCWSLIAGFQQQIRQHLPQMEKWPEKIAEVGSLGDRTVDYNLGHRSINDYVISLHHDDVLRLGVWLMENSKFRRIMADRYPVVLIDEYQDTNAEWVESIKAHFLGQPGAPVFGFFGDHWQKIYGDGCGKIESSALRFIGKEANFRSVITIVECLNRMRPELPQFVVDPKDSGTVRIFHTNCWVGQRQTGQHWGGDLPAEASHSVLRSLQESLVEEGWDFSPEHTKILMLTHRVLAAEQGYSSLPAVFSFNESFTKRENAHIAFFVDDLEPACRAFEEHRYGEMFLALGTSIPNIDSPCDKTKWSNAMVELIALRKAGTIGEVIAHLRKARMPRLSDQVEDKEHALETFDPTSGEEMPTALRELKDLHAVSYQEIIALTRYLDGHSPFETNHGVKGAEFENVVVVVGRGWNRYNFNEMLELASQPDAIPASKQEMYERNRNLFYVACSRPKRRLALLFTQKLSDRALQTVNHWFGAEAVKALSI